MLPHDVLEAFASAAVTALGELVQTEAFYEEVTDALARIPDGYFLAFMSLQRALPGTLALVLPAETARGLAQRYLPPGSDSADELLKDLAGEFANLIAGQAKTMLKGTPYHFHLSPPTAIGATDRAELSQRTVGARAVMVSFDWGQMFVFVELRPCEGA